MSSTVFTAFSDGEFNPQQISLSDESNEIYPAPYIEFD